MSINIFYYSSLTVILSTFLIRSFLKINRYNKMISNQSSHEYLQLNFWSILKDNDITKAKKFLYAYNGIPELELRTIYAVFKSKKDHTDSVSLIIDFFIKLTFPFVFWLLGVLTIIPSTIAQLKILPDKSNQATLTKGIADFYENILNTFGMGIIASIGIILISIILNSLLSSFIKENIKLRIEIIEQILESKFADKAPFLAQIEPGNLLKEQWEFEFVKFYNIPIEIIDIRGSVTRNRYIEKLSNNKLYTTSGEDYIKDKFTFRVDKNRSF